MYKEHPSLTKLVRMIAKNIVEIVIDFIVLFQEMLLLTYGVSIAEYKIFIGAVDPKKKCRNSIDSSVKAIWACELRRKHMFTRLNTLAVRIFKE